MKPFGQIQVFKLRLLIGLMLFNSLICVEAQLPARIHLPDSRITLEIPEGWLPKTNEKSDCMVPAAKGQDPYSQRKIHLNYARPDSATLSEAIEGEIDRITAISPKLGSSDDRRHYQGSTRIQTDSGLSGLRADFATETKEGLYYHLIKYYFLTSDQRIFKVCAHVNGNASVLKEYDSIIRAGLLSLPDK